MSNKQSVEDVWINGCETWIGEHVSQGWHPYYVNFMFQALRGTPKGIVEQMHTAIHKEFYSKFCLRFVHDPHRKKEQEQMPRLMLFPDRPVWKPDKCAGQAIHINAGGLHFNGPMLIAPQSRFHGCPLAHIDQNHWKYTGHITRIHIERMDGDFASVANYSAKTVKWNRADEDDILLLPKTSSELSSNPTLCDPARRAVKDLEGSLNLSPEVAHQLAANQKTAN
jgi:hypothetical protein